MSIDAIKELDDPLVFLYYPLVVLGVSAHVYVQSLAFVYSTKLTGNEHHFSLPLVQSHSRLQ